MARLNQFLNSVSAIIDEFGELKVGLHPAHEDDGVSTWVIHVYRVGDDVLIEESDDLSGADRAYSLSKFYDTLMKFSKENSELNLELNMSDPKERWQLHLPIVGAFINENPNAFVLRTASQQTGASS